MDARGVRDLHLSTSSAVRVRDGRMWPVQSLVVSPPGFLLPATASSDLHSSLEYDDDDDDDDNDCPFIMREKNCIHSMLVARGMNIQINPKQT